MHWGIHAAIRTDFNVVSYLWLLFPLSARVTHIIYFVLHFACHFGANYFFINNNCVCVCDANLLHCTDHPLREIKLII